MATGRHIGFTRKKEKPLVAVRPSWTDRFSWRFGGAIHRFNPDGSHDMSFGNDGALQNPLGEAVTVAPDGTLVLIGRARAPGKRWLVIERRLG